MAALTPTAASRNRRYSNLKQIDTSNVTRLTQAWTYNSRPAETTGAARASQVTPLVVNGVLYLLTYYQSLIAMEPETGKQLWVFAHRRAGRPPRGIAYWPGKSATQRSLCRNLGDFNKSFAELKKLVKLDCINENCLNKCCVIKVDQFTNLVMHSIFLIVHFEFLPRIINIFVN